MASGHLTYLTINYKRELLLALLLEERTETKKVLVTCLKSLHESLVEVVFFPLLKITRRFAGI